MDDQISMRGQVEHSRGWCPLALAATACALAVQAACAPRAQPRPFDGLLAYQLVAQQLDFGPRIPGTAAHRQMGDWIQAQLRAAGWEVKVQSFTYHGIELRNFIGLGGPEEELPLVLGAHYDTRPHADRDPLDPTAPVPGANDGGSGVAVLLELAAAMPPETLHRPVWLVFFDAEDSGGINGWEWIVGSTYFVDSLEQELAGAVIVDMVGDAELRLPLELNSSGSLQEPIWRMAAELGYPAFVGAPGPSLLDDHTPFLRAGIPAVDIIDFDYPPWHTQGDTLDKLSPDSLAQVGRTLQAWLQAPPEGG